MGFLASFDTRRVAMIFLVIVIAFAAGHFMQSGQSDEDHMARSVEGPDAAPMIQTEGGMRALPVPPAATLRPLAPPPALPERVEEVPTELLDDVRYSPFGAPCLQDATVSALANSVQVDLHISCSAWAFAVLRYDEAIREVRLDRFGRAQVILPRADATREVTVSIGGSLWHLAVPATETFSSAGLSR